METPPDNRLERARQDDDTAPIYYSRVGDFFVAGVAGALVLTGAVMLSDLEPIIAAMLAAIFIVALGIRYWALRRGVQVAPAVSFNDEQTQRFERLRAVLNALPQPVMLLDDQDRVEMTNPACRTVFGEDVNAKPISTLVRAPAALDALRAARVSGATQEAAFSSTGQGPRHGLFYAAPLDPIGSPRSPERERVLVMVRDRTAQKKLERMRTDFVANASHELRTPLTAILGFIETIETHAKDDPAAQAKFLGIMREQAERMLRLVRDLVNLSAIEIAESAPPTDRVDLTAIARAVCEMLGPIAARSGGETACELPQPVWVTGSKDQLTQVIQNLGDNALRYGGHVPDVLITTGKGIPPAMEGAARTGDTASLIAARLGVPEADIAWVRVEDQGEGIARSSLPRLTERFYRIDPQLSRTKGGTGLGLAIVKHVVQRHRGGLQIESVEGQGSAFTCFLPPALANDD